MPDFYYGMQISVGSSAAAAYIDVQLTSEATLDGTAVTLQATAPGMTFMEACGLDMHFELPPMRSLSASMTIVTSQDEISGTITATPALNSELTLELFGAGHSYGKVVVGAGETSGTFLFTGLQPKAMDQEQARAYLKDARSAN